jgi:hypothetical protein
VKTAQETFGVSGADLAATTMIDPQVAAMPVASTRVQNESPMNPLAALVDPSHSAIFWIGLAALLGLVMVTGQFRIQAALGGRAGKRR